MVRAKGYFLFQIKNKAGTARTMSTRTAACLAIRKHRTAYTRCFSLSLMLHDWIMQVLIVAIDLTGIDSHKHHCIHCHTGNR